MKSREEILREAREKVANKRHESILAEKPKIKAPAETNSKQSPKDKQREITSASIEKISADNFQKIVNDYNLNKSMEDSIKILQRDEKIGDDESVLIVEEIRKTSDETSDESSDYRTLQPDKGQGFIVINDRLVIRKNGRELTDQEIIEYYKDRAIQKSNRKSFWQSAKDYIGYMQKISSQNDPEKAVRILMSYPETRKIYLWSVAISFILLAIFEIFMYVDALNGF